ncbi:hypothetical protein COEX109129_18970 [Corallococcus exiguus]
MRRNSPFTGWPSISSAIFWVRSPSATATSTRATSVVGCTRSPIRALMDWTLVAQSPRTSPRFTRSPMRPSRPTTRSTRTISWVSVELSVTTALNARAISSMTTSCAPDGSRTEKSPPCTARSAASNCWSGGGPPGRRPSSAAGRLLPLRLREGARRAVAGSARVASTLLSRLAATLPCERARGGPASWLAAVAAVFRPLARLRGAEELEALVSSTNETPDRRKRCDRYCETGPRSQERPMSSRVCRM